MRSVVHIGFPKSASTFLQKHFFPHLDGVALLHAWPEDRMFRPLIHNMYFADDDEYMPRTLSTFLDEWRAAHPGTFLLSDENLSGGLFLATPNWERNADRFHALVPDTDILIVVRDQRTMLRSVYALYVQRGGIVTLSDLLAGRARWGRFDPDHLCYHRLIGRYKELYGADRVKVVPFEMLASDRQRFVEELTEYIVGPGVRPPEVRAARENRSLSPPSRWILRNTNRMFRMSTYNAEPTVMPLHVAGQLRPKLERTVDRLLSPDMRHKLEEKEDFPAPEWFRRYEESNAEVERLTGLCLSDWGYVLPSTSPATPGV